MAVDHSAQSGLRTRLNSLLARIRQSAFAKNAFYLTGISGVERVAGLAQTVLIARVLGITEYGIYGLLFGTIGYVSSVMGLQMGHTATVFVARYRNNEKAKAAAVINYVTRFAWIAAMTLLVVTLPFATPLTAWLFKSTAHTHVLILGCLFLVASLLSGVQDGIIQGFEDFKSVAIARLVGSMLTLATIYPAAIYYGLRGVLFALIGGVLVKYIILATVAIHHRRNYKIPRHGSGVSFFKLVRDFSFPSMLSNFLTGSVMWAGMLWLSRLPTGFAAVAMVNVGLQWRGPILLLTGAIESVALPAFGRFQGERDADGVRNLKRTLYWLSGTVVLCVTTIVSAGGHFILSLYGEEFRSGWLSFSLLALSTVPLTLAGVHMQDLAARAQMWRQFCITVPGLAIGLFGFGFLIPFFSDIGYALSLLFSSSVFLCLTVVDQLKSIRVHQLDQ